jgi:DNA repair exonuclease SbcCD ATPase subunit
MRSVSKIRRMQQLNEQLEQRYLNEQNPSLAGFRAKLGSIIGNLFRKKENETSPALQAAQARVEAKTKQLRNSIREFQDEFEKLYRDRVSEINDSIKKLEAEKSPNLEKVKEQSENLDEEYESILSKIKTFEGEIQTILGNYSA